MTPCLMMKDMMHSYYQCFLTGLKTCSSVNLQTDWVEEFCIPVSRMKAPSCVHQLSGFTCWPAVMFTAGRHGNTSLSLWLLQTISVKRDLNMCNITLCHSEESTLKKTLWRKNSEENILITVDKRKKTSLFQIVHTSNQLSVKWLLFNDFITDSLHPSSV